VAYENRISANHLSDEKPIADICKLPLTTFLPSVQEQEILAEELATLVGHKWAEHIPALERFEDYLPDNIYHKHMDMMMLKRKQTRYESIVQIYMYISILTIQSIAQYLLYIGVTGSYIFMQWSIHFICTPIFRNFVYLLFRSLAYIIL
jgi:hypothetical protein